MAGADDLQQAGVETEGGGEVMPPTLRGEELAEVINKTVGAVNVVEDDAKNAVDYPDAPEHGFSGPKDYSDFIADMNAKAVGDFAEFDAHPEKYRLRDPENPDKYVATVVHTCADGRCNPALYNDPSNPLQHLNLDWQPAAGLIYHPEISVSVSCADIEELLATFPKLKEKIFRRLDMMYGPAVEDFLKEHEEGVSSKLLIEYQSHFDKDHHPKHGCGAWKSNLADAQKETIKNSVIAEAWLKERYPEAFGKGLFRVIRTTQDNGSKNNVHDAEYIDEMLTPEEKGSFAGLFDEVKGRFAPTSLSDKENHIVRPHTGNPFNIDTAEHSEQGVRVSMFQWANTLNGQSAMEIIWNTDAKVLFDHIKILLGIIGKNKFSEANPEKPHYVHLDLVKGNQNNRAVFEQLRMAMESDPEIKPRLNDGTLFLIITETDRKTMKSEQLFG